MPTINKNSTRNRPIRWSTDNSAKYYGSKAWKDLRNAYITQHPLCENCLLEGRATAAEEVHHRVPWLWFNDELDRFKALTCPNFLMSLCSKCHHEIHKTLKRPDNFELTREYQMIHNM